MITHDTCPLCPFKVTKFTPGYHYDDTYECKFTIVDLRDNSCWEFNVSVTDFWSGDQKVVIAKSV